MRRPSDELLDEEAVLQVAVRLDELEAPLDRFVHRLHPWVAFGIMPVFPLANTGIDVLGLGPSQLLGPVSVGVAFGLFAGKMLGVFAFALAGVKLGLARLPAGASLTKLLGIAAISGIGLTVALFIAGLAYADSPELLDQAKLGILGGSLASGLAGALLLRLTSSAEAVEETGPARAGSAATPP